MTRARYASALIALPVFLALNGCSQQNDGIRSVRRGDAERMTAEHNRFEASADEPITAATHHAAGQFAENQGRPDIAMEQYLSALKLDPNHLPSLYRLAVLHAQAKQFSEAIATWKQYIQLTGNDATGHSNLGFCYELAGRLEEAEAAYQEGLGIDPRSRPCHINYGLMLARLGRTNEALLQLQSVLPPAQVHYNLGSVYELQGKREQARAEYRLALQLDPKMGGVKEKLASLE